MENNRAQQWGIWIRNWNVICQMSDGKINQVELFTLVANYDSLEDIFLFLQSKIKVRKCSSLKNVTTTSLKVI